MASVGDPDLCLDRGPTGGLHLGPGPVQGPGPGALQEGVGGPDMEVDIEQGHQHLRVMMEPRPTMLTWKKLGCFWSQALLSSVKFMELVWLPAPAPLADLFLAW